MCPRQVQVSRPDGRWAYTCTVRAVSSPPPPAQLQELVDSLAAATGAPATLEDRDLNLVVSSGHDDVIDEVRRSSILRRRSTAQVQSLFAAFGIARADRPLRIPADPDQGRLARWCVPVRWRRVTYGYLWLLDPEGRVSAEGLHDLDDLVEQVAASMAQRARTSDRVSWAVGELLADDAGVRARAREDLRRDGLLSHDRLVIAVLVQRNGGRRAPAQDRGAAHLVDDVVVPGRHDQVEVAVLEGGGRPGRGGQAVDQLLQLRGRRRAAHTPDRTPVRRPSPKT